jgi:hypothetical protein
MADTWLNFNTPFRPLKGPNPPDMWHPLMFPCHPSYFSVIRHIIVTSFVVFPRHLPYNHISLPRQIRISQLVDTSLCHISVVLSIQHFVWSNHSTYIITVQPHQPTHQHLCMICGILWCYHFSMLMSALYRLPKFTCSPKNSDGHKFCIWIPFEVPFASLEISYRALRLGIIFIEF